jgi:hypothetical protein
VGSFLAANRLAGGKWVQRDPLPVQDYQPTADEVAAAEAEARRAEDARLEAIEMEIVRLSGPDQLLRSMGKITIAELNSRVSVIRARVEAEFT